MTMGGGGGATCFVQFLCSSLSHSLSLCSFEKCFVFSHPQLPCEARRLFLPIHQLHGGGGKSIRFALMRTHVRFISRNQESSSISCRPCNLLSPSLSPPVFSAPPPHSHSPTPREEEEGGLRWSSAIAMLMPPLT